MLERMRQGRPGIGTTPRKGTLVSTSTNRRFATVSAGGISLSAQRAGSLSLMLGNLLGKFGPDLHGFAPLDPVRTLKRRAYRPSLNSMTAC
jgi:hypothetical protein